MCQSLYHGADYSSNLAGPMVLRGKLPWRFNLATLYKPVYFDWLLGEGKKFMFIQNVCKNDLLLVQGFLGNHKGEVFSFAA